MCVNYNAIWSYWSSLKSDRKKNKMFSVNKTAAKIFEVSLWYRPFEWTYGASERLLHGWCVARPFRGVGQTNNDDAGICDSNAVGTRTGGYRTREDFCHSGSHSRAVPQRAKEPGGTHLPFSALTAAQQSSFSLSLSFLPAHLPLCRLLSFANPSPFSNPRSTVTASAVHRHRHPGLHARGTRARDIAPHLRQRIRQRVVFVLRVMLRCGAPLLSFDADIVGSLSFFLSISVFLPFPLSSLSLSFSLVLRSDLVRLWSQADNAADSGNRNVWSVCDNALSGRNTLLNRILCYAWTQKSLLQNAILKKKIM